MRGLSHVVNHVIIISTSMRILFHLLLLLLAAACFKYGGFVEKYFHCSMFIFFFVIVMVVAKLLLSWGIFCVRHGWMNESINRNIIHSRIYPVWNVLHRNGIESRKNDRDGRIRGRERKMEAEHNLDQSIKRYEHERETCHAIDTQSEWKYLRTGNFFPMVTFSVDVEKREWTACLKNNLMWFICWLWRRCINLWVPLLPIKIYCSLLVCAIHCDGLCFNFYASFTFFSHFVCQSLGEFFHSIQKWYLHMDPLSIILLFISYFFIRLFAHFVFYSQPHNRLRIANKPKRPHKFIYIHAKLVFISYQNYYRNRLIENVFVCGVSLFAHTHEKTTTF